MILNNVWSAVWARDVMIGKAVFVECMETSKSNNIMAGILNCACLAVAESQRIWSTSWIISCVLTKRKGF